MIKGCKSCQSVIHEGLGTEDYCEECVPGEEDSSNEET